MKNRIKPWSDALQPSVRRALQARARAAASAGVLLLQVRRPDVWIQTFEFTCPGGCHSYRAHGLFIRNPDNGCVIELTRLSTEAIP